MQELEKILEEMKESSITVATSKEHYIHPQDGRFVEEVVLLDDIEKIIHKHMNDGWIPVEKEQPEEDGFYIATMDGKIVGQEEPFVGLAEFENGKWIDDEEDYKCVIAWRPMPEVYRPADKTERSEA